MGEHRNTHLYKNRGYKPLVMAKQAEDTMTFRRYMIGETHAEALKGPIYKRDEIVEVLATNPKLRVFTTRVTVSEQPLKLKDL